MILSERARAKLNLTLHVVRRRADGWHELESLVAFASTADVLTLDMNAPLALSLGGPRAAGLSMGEDNLILKAAHALSHARPNLKLGAFHLIKYLPHAAGIGGGSADAAATLRMLARANDISLDDPLLKEIAATIGADVSVCLHSHASMMRGVGEQVTRLEQWPVLYCVMVNGGVPLDTKKVFERMNLPCGTEFTTKAHPEWRSLSSADTVIEALRQGRNDMEDAASVLAPVVGDVLAALGAARGCRLVRMSGSGGTCFGLFVSRHQARTAARTITRAHPNWWVSAGVLR